MRCLNDSTYPLEYSVCTLVTDFDEYREMVASFNRAGFTDADTEFLYVDNSNGNTEDGYSGLNKFLNRASGKYIIICHQDILLKFDDVGVLKQRLAEMDRLDPDWAVLGNAGYGDFNTKLYRITDPWGADQKIGTLPARARSLDENFLLVKNDANLALSHDLKGFHLYATDLCALADMLGWNAYVIDFHLYHKSGGNCNESFFASKNAFMDKYARIVRPMAIRTTCTMMLITSAPFLNRIINKKLFYSIRKRLDSLFQ